MLIKRILLLLPILIAAALFQSYFWVPTFSDQTKGGSDERLRQFITGSIGDAQILNPILHADTASGAIVDQIFEGLIDRDRDLSYRGRLAASWKIYEEAFFVPHPEGPGAKALAARIERARAEGGAQWLKNVEKIEAVAPAEQKTTIRTPPPKGGKAPGRKAIVIAYPERVKVTLKSVDQDLFKHLDKLLGEKWVARDPAALIKTKLPEALLPFAARRVKLTEHNPIIIFKIRRGVRFHDGHEFDSGDVRFTYEAILNPKNLSPRVPDYEPVKRVETPDKFTVKITYKRLYSPAFGSWGMGMLPEHLLNAEKLAEEAKQKGKDPNKFSMRDSAFNRKPVGTGPFVFKEWRSDELIRLGRNEGYWEGPPEYHEYVYRILPDPLTQEITFYAGTVDRYGAGAHQVERLKKDPRFQVFSGLGFGYTYVGYNMRRWPFQDARVRRALGMAVNTAQIHRYVLNGEAEDITGPFVKQSPHYNKKIKPVPYDPEGAVRLLHEAGFRKKDGILMKDGKPLAFNLMTNHGNEIRRAVGTVVQDAWKKIGVKITFSQVEWAVFIRKHVNQLNFDAVVLGWSMGLDPDLYQIWHSSQTNKGQLNFVGYKNPKADDLIIKIRQEYDLAKQVRYAHALHSIIAADQPYTFLYVGKWTALLDRKIAIARRLRSGKLRPEKIRPTITGSYSFDFNEWLKFPKIPRFEN